MRGAPELAEAAGTFALVLAGCGAIMVDGLTGTIEHIGVAAAFGIVVAAMIYTVGHVSGAHFNPAVTIAFAATGHFPWRRVPGYIASQCTAALAAAVLLVLVLEPLGPGTFGQTAPDLLPPAATFAVEVVLTAMLMFVIASVATDGRAVGHMAGMAIGGTVFLNALWAGPLTGASMNPARSLGPGVLAGSPHLWIYLTAPLLGAALGAALYEAIRGGARPTKRGRPDVPAVPATGVRAEDA